MKARLISLDGCSKDMEVFDRQDIWTAYCPPITSVNITSDMSIDVYKRRYRYYETKQEQMSVTTNKRIEFDNTGLIREELSNILISSDIFIFKEVYEPVQTLNEVCKSKYEPYKEIMPVASPIDGMEV